MNELNLDLGSRDAPVAGVDTVIRPAAGAVGADHAAKVQAAAEKFEGFFIAQLLRQMRQGTREMAGDDSIFSSRVNQDMLDMADVALADVLAGRRAFGIADAILRQLLPSQDAIPVQATDRLQLAPAEHAMPLRSPAPVPLATPTGAVPNAFKFTPPPVASFQR